MLHNYISSPINQRMELSSEISGFNNGTLQHWAEGLRQCVISLTPKAPLPFSIVAGVSDARFVTIGNVHSERITYLRGESQIIEEGSIILQLNDLNISGLTSQHVEHTLKVCANKGGPLAMNIVRPNLLTCDLRQYLCMRFPKHSMDHDLQNTIRENVYLVTVPYTTRAARLGESEGIDYRFVTVEQFLELDKSGQLLETGLYEGNYYGTPKPSDNAILQTPALSPNTAQKISARRRTDLGDMAPLFANGHDPSLAINQGTLGPMPSNWEMAMHDGEPYFIDHNTGTTQWTDPRLGITELDPDERLPPGWEKVEDPQYGTYFVDHINKHTQYEKPNLGGASTSNGYAHTATQSQMRGRRVQSVPEMSKHTRRARFTNGHLDMFTRNPNELQGELVTTNLDKGPGGVGFTLIGNDSQSPVDEFLQIKSVIPNGPAYIDAKLRMGDVLVYINETCVLGAKQDDAIRLFKSVPVGGSVRLQVCRGYPLLFDNDSQVITTNAYMPNENQKDGTLLRPPQMLTVDIVKGDLGFGFTIADSAHGQKVKKILDKARCRGLHEGDLLCDINGVNVRRMSHSDIVDVLRDCEVGQRAKMLVQRPPPLDMGSLSLNGRVPPSIAIKPRLNQAHSVERPHSYHPTFTDSDRNDRRSKTPTAEFQYGYTNGGSNGHDPIPSVKSRARTLGPIPPRPTKPNGYMASSTHFNHTSVPGTSYNSESIYENLPKQERSRSPGNMILRREHSHNIHNAIYSNSSASTPNYVPASVYTNRYQHSNSSNAPSVVSSQMQSNYGDNHAPHYDQITVNLIRQAQGFGFRVMGGSEANTPIRVGPLLPGGAAALDGRLFEGDEIVEIDNEKILGQSHKTAIQLMQRSSQNGHVKLVVRRPIITNGQNADMSRSVSMPARIVNNHSPKIYPYDVIVSRNENEGFGFVIISAVNKNGSTIGRIIDGSPAARCGELNVNDRIVSVNGINILNMHHGAIVNLIKDCGLVVTLTVGDPNEGYISGAPSIVGNNVAPQSIRNNAPLERRESLNSIMNQMQSGFGNYNEEFEYSQINVSEPPTPEYRLTPTFLTVAGVEPRSFAEKARASEEFVAVELDRGNKGFGFSIRGGQEFGSMPLFILRIAEGGPAHLDGRVQVGDQLIEINAVSTNGMSHENAIELIKSQSTVRLLIRRHPTEEATVVGAGGPPSVQDINATWNRST